MKQLVFIFILISTFCFGQTIVSCFIEKNTNEDGTLRSIQCYTNVIQVTNGVLITKEKDYCIQSNEELSNFVTTTNNSIRIYKTKDIDCVNIYNKYENNNVMVVDIVNSITKTPIYYFQFNKKDLDKILGLLKQVLK